MKHQYALITGASNGIGKALAEECGRRGMNLCLVALPQTGLLDVAGDISATYGVDVKAYEADLTDKDQIEGLYNYISSNGIQLNALINNAGIGYEGAFASLTPAFCEKIMILNTQTVVMLTRMFIENLQQAEKAYIMNVSSTSGLTIVPFKTLYSASKAFIYSFTRALRIELKDSSVSVSVLCPGPVPTNPEVRTRIESHGGMGAMFTMEPHELAEIAISEMLKGKAAIIPGIWNKVFLTVGGLLPKGFQVYLMTRHFNNIRKQQEKKIAAAM
jgi:short-subunit dehydrogenase